MRITDEWLAGFVDGEGWLGLGGNGHTPQMRIGSTNKEALEAIQEYCGVGNIYSIFPENAKHKAAWHWSVTQQQATAAVCETLLPYLNVKRRQAEILIRLVDIKPATGRRPDLISADYQSRLLERQSLTVELSELNRRGPVATAVRTSNSSKGGV